MFSNRTSAKAVDFNQEARDLWARLNLDPSTRGGELWNALDPIFRHPTGKRRCIILLLLYFKLFMYRKWDYICGKSNSCW